MAEGEDGAPSQEAAVETARAIFALADAAGAHSIGVPSVGHGCAEFSVAAGDLKGSSMVSCDRGLTPSWKRERCCRILLTNIPLSC